MDVGLQWNDKKCAVVHVKRMSLWEFRGSKDRWLWIDTEFEAGLLSQIPSGNGKFQTRRSACAKRCSESFQRMSVRLSGPSLFLTIIKCWHLTGSHCPSCNVNSDRGVGKAITQSGGKHPLGSTELVYLPGKHGGRGVIKVSGGRIYID